MKHAGQGAFAALVALTLVSPLSVQAQDAPEQKSGFFRQLGKGLADTGKQMVGIKPNAGSKAGSQGTGSIYTPVSGAGKLRSCSRVATTSRPSSGGWSGPESR